MSTPDRPAPDVAGTVFEHGAQEIARSYAQALMGLLADPGRSGPALDELEELVADVWAGQPEFAALLSGSLAHADRRDEMLVAAFDGRLDPLLLRFLRVVNRRGRLGLLPLIVREARALDDRRHHRVAVTVRSAVPLDEDQVEAVRGRLRELLPGRSPTLSFEVDPELIGGLVLQVGDRVYDASVRAGLKEFHDRLLASRYREIKARRDQLAHHPD